MRISDSSDSIQQKVDLPMNIETLAQTLHRQIGQFLQHSDFSQEGKKVFKQHEQNIIQFTKVSQCIPVCFLILQHESKPEIQYFASLILKDKLKYDFDQLSSEVILNAHAKIIQIIKKYESPTKVVVLNIALCLTYIYIHYFEQFSGILDFLNKTFSSIQPTITTQYFCKVLKLVPEEAVNSRVVIDEEKRQKAMDSLETQQREVLIQLHNTVQNLNQNSKISKTLLFEIFSNWIEVGYNQQIMTNVHNHNVLQMAFQSIKNPLESNEATGCILEVITTLSSEYNETVFDFLAQNIFAMIRQIDELLENDLEIAENYIKVCAQFGNKASRTFIQKYNDNVKNYILQLIKITRIQELQVFNDLYDFWNSFLFELNEKNPEYPVTFEEGKIIVSKLFISLIYRVRYSMTNLQELNKIQEKKLFDYNEDIEDLYEIRNDTRDLFEKIIQYLGQQTYVNEVMMAIKGLQTGSKDFWTVLESYLFSLRDALHDYPIVTGQVVQLVKGYDEIGDKYEIIRRNYIRIFQQLFQIKEKNQQFLNKLFQNILQMFSREFMFERVEKAFEKGCKENPSLLYDNISSIIELLKKFPNKQHLLKGVMRIIVSKEQIFSQYLNEVWNILSESLKTSQNKKERVSLLESFLTILSAFPDKKIEPFVQTLTSLFESVWPILKHIIQNPTTHFAEEDKLIEKTCKLLKRFMRKLHTHFLNYIQQIFSIILNQYKNNPQPPYVYLLEVAITVYGQSQSHPQVLIYLQGLYEQFYGITFHHLSTIKDSFSQLQYLIDDFIGLHIRIFVYNAGLILNSGKVQQIIRFTSKCLISNIPKLASSASHLFQAIFMIYWSPYSREKYRKTGYGEIVKLNKDNENLYNHLRTLIRPSVTEMIVEMLKSLETGPPQFVRDNIIDCMKAAILAFPIENVQIWQNPLQLLNQDILTQIEKNKFKENLVKLTSNDIQEFTKAELKIEKLLYTITRRFLYRKSRQNIPKQIM